MMTVAKESLLVKFRTRDTLSGVTRKTVKELVEELDMNETQVVHMALSKFAVEVVPAYAPDDGTLTTKQIKALRIDAEKHMPNGKTLSTEVLFPRPSTGNSLLQATSFGVCFQRYQIPSQAQNHGMRLL